MFCIPILLLVFGSVTLSSPLYYYPYDYYYPRGYGYNNYGNNYRGRRDTEVVLRYNTPYDFNSQSAMMQYPSVASLSNSQVPSASRIMNPSVYMSPNGNTNFPTYSSGSPYLNSGTYGLPRYRRAVALDTNGSPARLAAVNTQVPVLSEITSTVPVTFVHVPLVRYIPIVAQVPM